MRKWALKCVCEVIRLFCRNSAVNLRLEGVVRLTQLLPINFLHTTKLLWVRMANASPSENVAVADWCHAAGWICTWPQDPQGDSVADSTIYGLFSPGLLVSPDRDPHLQYVDSKWLELNTEWKNFISPLEYSTSGLELHFSLSLQHLTQPCKEATRRWGQWRNYYMPTLLEYTPQYKNFKLSAYVRSVWNKANL